MIRFNKTLVAGLVALSTVGIAGVAQAQNSPSDLWNGTAKAPANVVDYHAAQQVPARSSLDARAAYVSGQFGGNVAAAADQSVRDAEIRDHYWSN